MTTRDNAIYFSTALMYKFKTEIKLYLFVEPNIWDVLTALMYLFEMENELYLSFKLFQNWKIKHVYFWLHGSFWIHPFERQVI